MSATFECADCEARISWAYERQAVDSRGAPCSFHELLEDGNGIIAGFRIYHTRGCASYCGDCWDQLDEDATTAAIKARADTRDVLADLLDRDTARQLGDPRLAELADRLEQLSPFVKAWKRLEDAAVAYVEALRAFEDSKGLAMPDAAEDLGEARIELREATAELVALRKAQEVR